MFPAGEELRRYTLKTLKTLKTQVLAWFPETTHTHRMQHSHCRLSVNHWGVALRDVGQPSSWRTTCIWGLISRNCRSY